MSSKKQRRRREKLQRHEYEYVVETEEGEEIIESPKAPAAKKETAGKQPKLVDARGRQIKPPSLERVLKRGAIFGPILFILVFLLNDQLSTGAKILNAVILVAIFLPFSYLVDHLVYRAMVKRARKQQAG